MKVKGEPERKIYRIYIIHGYACTQTSGTHDMRNQQRKQPSGADIHWQTKNIPVIFAILCTIHVCVYICTICLRFMNIYSTGKVLAYSNLFSVKALVPQQQKRHNKKEGRGYWPTLLRGKSRQPLSQPLTHASHGGTDFYRDIKQTVSISAF